MKLLRRVWVVVLAVFTRAGFLDGDKRLRWPLVTKYTLDRLAVGIYEQGVVTGQRAGMDAVLRAPRQQLRAARRTVAKLDEKRKRG